jgi:hypothetical protein
LDSTTSTLIDSWSCARDGQQSESGGRALRSRPTQNGNCEIQIDLVITAIVVTVVAIMTEQ